MWNGWNICLMDDEMIETYVEEKQWYDFSGFSWNVWRSVLGREAGGVAMVTDSLESMYGEEEKLRRRNVETVPKRCYFNIYILTC